MIDIDFIHESAEGAMMVTGFDDCIVGISEEFGRETRIIYSKEKMIEKLIIDEEMTEEDALEHFYYNIVGSHFGDRDPIFLVTYF